MPTRLPVFPVSPARADSGDVKRLATSLFGVDQVEIDKSKSHIAARSGALLVEFDRMSGGFWAADQQHLWNASEKPSLLPEEEVYDTAGKLLDRLDVLPSFHENEPFVLTKAGLGRTEVATRPADGTITRHRLDLQARFEVAVRNPGVDDAPDLLPVVGGGGKFALALGDEGRPVAYRGLWRPAGDAEIVEALDVEEAKERFARLMKNVEVDDVSTYLAYYSAPVASHQQMLTPVYVFRATIVSGGNKVSGRLVTIPATKLGPEVPEPKPQPPRPRQPERPRPHAARRGERDEKSHEAGTSWIGLSGGLPKSQANAQGFVDGLAADGWNINFNWGDGNAWESDWNSDDDTWVDAADFVFYTGHADSEGWMLSSPDDGALDFAEVGAAAATPGDLWGQQNLEWVIIAACGPLQDEVIAAGGGDALARWDGAFDGLHSLMGYGSLTLDNAEEGQRVIKYATQGVPLIDAWFRTAQEIQPSTNPAPPPDGPNVWVGAMWAFEAGADPRSDRLWGHGAVAADPTSPSGYACMWTTC